MQLLLRDKTLRGAAYISVYRDKKPIPVGTAFFVDISLSPRQNAMYAVTARHVIEGESKIDIEFTNTDGEYRVIHTRGKDWMRSSKTDVACLRFPDTGADTSDELLPIHIVRFLRPQSSFREGEPRLQAGMDVYMVGLFVNSPFRESEDGHPVMTPIARFGKVALEKTNTLVYLDSRHAGRPEKAVSVPAFLIESTSFEGESGSPVFVYREHVVDERQPKAFPARQSFGPRQVRITDEDISTPLAGMISSHWKIGDAGLNSGIAVVIPSDDIKEFLINDPSVKKDRESIRVELLNKPASPLSAKPPEPEFSKDDFVESLKKVSRKLQAEK